MHKYFLEFTLSTHDYSMDEIKECLLGLGESLEILPLPQCDTERARNYKIHLNVEDAMLVFDTCAQLGKIKSVRINEN